MNPLRTKFLVWLTCAALLCFATIGGVAAAVIVTNTAQEGPGNTFAVSNSDLLQTNLASFQTTGGFGSFGGGPISVLFNGIFGASGAVFDGQNIAPGTGATLTFSLNLSVNTMGYDLTQLTTIASWDTGRDGQEYSISYSTVSAPGVFISLAIIPQFNPQGVVDTLNSHTRVSVTDSNGILASNVAHIRYTFTSFENSGTAYREIDVLGVASVPEPTTFGLLALGAGAFILRTVRQQRQKARSLRAS